MKRIFISFAIEDENLRDLLKGQSRNTNSPLNLWICLLSNRGIHNGKLDVEQGLEAVMV